MKKILLGTFMISILFAGIARVVSVNAETKDSFASSLAEKIAQKFGLDQNQVQAVIDDAQKEHHTQIEQKMQQRLNDRLTQLVQQGKITDAQKKAIVDKLAELKKNFNPDNLKSLTPEQRKAEIYKQKTDLDNWAKSQGIDPSYLMFGFGRHRFGGHPPQQ